MNVQLLKNGLEQERLQYTRIGFPFYDLKELFKKSNKTEFLTTEILNRVVTEF